MVQKASAKTTVDDILRELSVDDIVTLCGECGTEYAFFTGIPALGQGGFGKVVRAIRKSDHRAFAIKIFNVRDERYEPERTQREADVFRILADKDEHRIVHMHDIIRMPHSLKKNEQDTRIFALVFELLEGAKLSAYMLEDHPLSETVHIFNELVGATKSLHEEGVVHRDLKPDNVFRTEGGGIVIFDLGAAFVKGLPKLTLVKSVITTPGYMGNEWLNGEEHVEEPSADIFNLYAMLFEMLAGGVKYRQGSGYLDLVILAKSDLGFGDEHRARISSEVRNHTAWPAIDALLVAMSNRDKNLRPNINEVQSRLAEIMSLVSRDDIILPSQRGRSLLEAALDDAASGANKVVTVKVAMSNIRTEEVSDADPTPILPVMPTSLQGVTVKSSVQEMVASAKADADAEPCSEQPTVCDIQPERTTDDQNTHYVSKASQAPHEARPLIYASTFVYVLCLLSWFIAGASMMYVHLHH